MFGLANNRFCGDVPTEVEAMSAGVKTNWFIKNGNDDLGTPCSEISWADDCARFPELQNWETSTETGFACDGEVLGGRLGGEVGGGGGRHLSPHACCNTQDKTGTLPTEVGRMSYYTHMQLDSCALTGELVPGFFRPWVASNLCPPHSRRTDSYGAGRAAEA